MLKNKAATSTLMYWKVRGVKLHLYFVNEKKTVIDGGKLYSFKEKCGMSFAFMNIFKVILFCNYCDMEENECHNIHIVAVNSVLSIVLPIVPPELVSLFVSQAWVINTVQNLANCLKLQRHGVHPALTFCHLHQGIITNVLEIYNSLCIFLAFTRQKRFVARVAISSLYF